MTQNNKTTNTQVKENEITPKAAQKALTPLKFWQSISLGCDPEFFFSNDKGETVGSEKVLPKEGCLNRDPYNGNRIMDGGSKTIIDGVQAEINPRSSSCRESLAGEISYCFKNLRDHILKDTKFTVQVTPLVDISQTELDSLSEGSRVFGCAPSTNVYQDEKESAIKVDPKKYLRRMAGGHLHLGNYFMASLTTAEGQLRAEDKEFGGRYAIAKRTQKALKETPEIMVPILDILVGNTCVLLDRDGGNKERRVNYGRAGEHRIKSYGIEYRTLSNFWLRSYPLMSFVLGMARFAVHVVEQSTPDNDYVKAFLEAVDKADIVKAINENDFDLALANFKKIESLIVQLAGEGDYAHRYYPLKGSVMQYFYHFVRRGVNYWFKEDAFTHWIGNYSSRGGWETFVLGYVKPDLEKYQSTAIDLNDLDPATHKEKEKKAVMPEVAAEVIW